MQLWPTFPPSTNGQSHFRFGVQNGASVSRPPPLAGLAADCAQSFGQSQLYVALRLLCSKAYICDIHSTFIAKQFFFNEYAIFLTAVIMTVWSSFLAASEYKTI